MKYSIEKKKSYKYASTDESFDAAVSALKEILDSLSKGDIRLGIIGCGNMGTSHIQNILAGCMPEFELTAVADLKEERRKAALELCPSIKVYNDGSELINSGEVDAVLVAKISRDVCLLVCLSVHSWRKGKQICL